jgi:uncharacterized UPF0160 family protein
MKTKGKGKVKTIVAHNGKFHADDVFAVATLKTVLKGQLKIVRTRNQKLIGKADWVVDVGGVYNSRNNRFDHHQPKGAGKRKNGVPYASFGLVWKKYGKKICGSVEVADYLDRRLVQFIDAEDNGFRLFKSIKDFLPYTISNIVSVFNPGWSDKKSAGKHFKETVKIAEQIISKEILRAKAAQKDKKSVLNAYQKASDKRIILLSKSYRWQEFLVPLAKPRFVVYPEDNFWRVMAVKKSLLGFAVRKPFPKRWSGRRGESLADLSGVEDALFCHKNLFLAVAKSRKGAIQLAEIALGKKGKNTEKFTRIKE